MSLNMLYYFPHYSNSLLEIYISRYKCVKKTVFQTQIKIQVLTVYLLLKYIIKCYYLYFVLFHIKHICFIWSRNLQNFGIAILFQFEWQDYFNISLRKQINDKTMLCLSIVVFYVVCVCFAQITHVLIHQSVE